MFDMNLQFAINKIKALKSYISWWKKLRLQEGKCAYFFGIPTHTNIGDSAIVVAESCFLKRCGYNSIIEITSHEYVYNRKCIRRLLPRRATIFLPGGGNMGSLWPNEEQWRCQIIEDFKDHPITVFPQTVYYGNGKDEQELMDYSVDVYNSAANLTLVAREKKSYDTMRQLYPKCKVYLAPDVVLSMNYITFKQQREGILTCFRNDKEKKVSDNSKIELIQKLRSAGYSVFETDTMAEGPISEKNREEIVWNKLKQIASARLLITDRLHGMVFAAITGTPCIVFGNNHHKVSGTYEWLRDLKYIEFANDLSDIQNKVAELYDMEACLYPGLNEKFGELREHVIKNMRGI